jgi:type II restriction enzyme sinI
LDTNFTFDEVKNKYNTENSSSSAISIGTQVQKWNRLSRQKAKKGKYNPVPN